MRRNVISLSPSDQSERRVVEGCPITCIATPQSSVALFLFPVCRFCRFSLSDVVRPLQVMGRAAIDRRLCATPPSLVQSFAFSLVRSLICCFVCFFKVIRKTLKATTEAFDSRAMCYACADVRSCRVVRAISSSFCLIKMGLTVPDEYPWILFIVVLTVLHYAAQTLPVGGMRKRLFTKEFFDRKFPDLKSPPVGTGYPDMGQGRFADALNIEDWVSFNNYQRAHLNYMELVTPIVVVQLVSGLFFPRISFLASIVVLVGRQLFGMGYRSTGSSGRLVGAITADVGMITLLLAALYGSFSAAGGLAGFTSFAASLLKF